MGGHRGVVHLLLRACCRRADADAVCATAANLGLDLDLARYIAVRGLTPAATSISDGATPATVPQQQLLQQRVDTLDARITSSDAAAADAAAAAAEAAAQSRLSLLRRSGWATLDGNGVAATASASTVGGIVASQTRSRRARDDASEESSGEDPVVDACEPAVSSALLQWQQRQQQQAQLGSLDAQQLLLLNRRAGGSNSSTSKLLGTSSSTSGVSTLMYMPPSELATTQALSVSTPLWMRFGQSGGISANNIGSSSGASVAAATAAAAALSVRGTGGATLTSSALLRNTFNVFLRGGSLPPPSDALLLSTAEHIDRAGKSTAASYMAQCAVGDALNASLLSRVTALLQRSRVCAGTGALVTRQTLDLDSADESGYTALFIAASAGRADLVAFLLAAGADASVPTKRGKSALYGAVEKCCVDVVQLLLHRYTGAQLRSNTTYGTNILHAANKAGNNRVKVMLEE